jgi:hypothetical protein
VSANLSFRFIGIWYFGKLGKLRAKSSDGDFISVIDVGSGWCLVVWTVVGEASSSSSCCAEREQTHGQLLCLMTRDLCMITRVCCFLHNACEEAQIDDDAEGGYSSCCVALVHEQAQCKFEMQALLVLSVLP